MVQNLRIDYFYFQSGLPYILHEGKDPEGSSEPG